MFVVSFYSFKGGVGRTVTLLNTAWQLARRGAFVALLDLDLEAPGLHNARIARRVDAWQSAEPAVGFFDLVGQYCDTGAVDGWIDTFLVQGLGPQGRMALLPARGTGAADPEYLHRYEAFVQGFSWQRFYSNQGGLVFMERLLHDLAAKNYDYLLIDARTGHTDVAGLTLLQLPDLVVLLTNLTDQSMNGIRGQIDLIHIVNSQCATAAGSRFRRQGKQRSPITVLTVASPLPRGEIRARQAQLQRAESRLDRPIDVCIEYLPLLALTEEQHILVQQLEVQGRDDLLEEASRPYDQLVREIVAHNPAAPENLLIEGDELRLLGRWREALAHYDEVEDRYRNRANEVVVRQAQLGKARALALALNPVKARSALSQLVDARREEPIGWAELAAIAHGYLAASRAAILLDSFSEAASDAHEAVKLAGRSRNAERQSAAQAARHSLRTWGADQQALLATCELFHGQALSLCEQWTEACAALERGVQLFGALGTRPLLHAISCTELARSRIGAMRLSKARTAVASAEALLEPAASRQDGGTEHIASTYVRSRVLQAGAEVAAEEGRGITALRCLVRALGEFQVLNEEVASVEVTVTLFGLVCLGTNRRRILREAVDHADWWQTWWRPERHPIPTRLLSRLSILWPMRGLPAPRPARWQQLAEPSKTLAVLVELQPLRTFLSAHVPTPDHPLAHVGNDHLGKLADLSHEAAHELLLLKVLWAVASRCLDQLEKPDPSNPLLALRKHADLLASENMLRREAQARLALALAERDRAGSVRRLMGCLRRLEGPATEWAWNLPLEFVAYAPGLAAAWRELAPALADFWPRAPRAELSSTAP